MVRKGHWRHRAQSALAPSSSALLLEEAATLVLPAETAMYRPASHWHALRALEPMSSVVDHDGHASQVRTVPSTFLATE